MSAFRDAGGFGGNGHDGNKTAGDVSLLTVKPVQRSVSRLETERHKNRGDPMDAAVARSIWWVR